MSSRPVPPAPRVDAVVDGLAVVRRRPADADSDIPTVLLVHGAMDRAASFGRVMRRLPALDVIALDRRGYGSSERSDAGAAGPEGASLAAHAADLATVAEWSGAESLVLVGHSLGGLVAVLAAQGPLAGHRLAALAAFEAPTPWAETHEWASGEDTLEVARREGPAAAAESFHRSVVGDRVWTRLREHDRSARRREGPALVAELEDARRVTSSPHREPLGVPAVFARGEHGPPHLQRAAERLAGLVGGRVQDVPGVGHGAHLTHPDLFARWVASVADPGGAGAFVR